MSNQESTITFTTFLTLMAEHLSSLDTEVDLLEAFACFDEGDKGFIARDELGKWLIEVGDAMSQTEVGRLCSFGKWTD